ncbi:protein ALTERED PHOSPHATE STARVATION RESPONSE 1-like [Miscanthus floridulus]|uniref:protein ALTERED PHOSPHATE STARVATION RESPONSE 1-like n=1 Tax=Miscanthus floridulus TaxID=154761 RepID=UPI00345A5849
MGCSSSKLDEVAAVKTCHDRKSFVKKAIAQRDLLASSHAAYVQSLRRVSMALLYYFAEDEHLYRLQESSYVHHPGSPEKVLVINCLRPAGASVHPVVEQWEPPEAIEAATIDRFFGTDDPFFRPSSIDPLNGTPVSPQPPRCDRFWDPFSSLADHPNYGVEEVKDDREDEQIPEQEEESDDDVGSGEGEGEAEEVEEKGEEAAAAAPVVPPPAREKVEKKVDHVKNELRVLATAEVEQHNGAPGFTVYVDRPPASMGEAMTDIQGHFMKILDTAKEVSVLLEPGGCPIPEERYVLSLFPIAVCTSSFH